MNSMPKAIWTMGLLLISSTTIHLADTNVTNILNCRTGNIESLIDPTGSYHALIHDCSCSNLKQCRVTTNNSASVPFTIALAHTFAAICQARVDHDAPRPHTQQSYFSKTAPYIHATKLLSVVDPNCSFFIPQSNIRTEAPLIIHVLVDYCHAPSMRLLTVKNLLEKQSALLTGNMIDEHHVFSHILLNTHSTPQTWDSDSEHLKNLFGILINHGGNINHYSAPIFLTPLDTIEDIESRYDRYPRIHSTPLDLAEMGMLNNLAEWMQDHGAKRYDELDTSAATRISATYT